MKLASLFISNDSSPVAETKYERITLNLLPGTKTRIETLEERQHTVIPMVMMVEGVHEGSSGPLYYPPEEMAKTPQIWNHKPIVVYHPTMNGQGISACDPTVVNTRKVGLIMNTSFDEKTKKLKSEAWIEKDRANKVDERIFKAITNNEMMEVSTGLFIDMEKKEGKWNGEDYVGIVRNIRADHLAILPDMTGACSIKDGAGLLRNSSLEKNEPEAWNGLKMLLRKAGFGYLLRNEMSFDNIRQQLCAALQQKFGSSSTDPMNPAYYWVQDVYSNFFVYQYEGKLFRLGYTATDTGVTLGDEKPVEVKQVTEYRTVGGAFIGNQDQPQQTEINMNKTQLIAAILAANCGWSDQKALEGLSDKQLEVIHNGAVPKPTNNAPAPDPKKVLVDNLILKNGWAEADRPALMALNEQQLAKLVPVIPAPAAPATTTTNSNPANVLSWDQVIAVAPAEVREGLKALGVQNSSEKAALIETIVSNTSAGFTKEALQSLPLETLRPMAKLATPPVQVPGIYQPNYAGMAPTAPVQNSSGKPKDEEPLLAPVLNFKKEAAATKA